MSIFWALGSSTALTQESGDDEGRFRVTSSTFTDHGNLPLSAIDNIVVGGVNVY